jgi:hypothetical protein
MLQRRETPVAMVDAAALHMVRRPTPGMAAPGDDNYTPMDPRAAPKRDQGRRDAHERRDHGERLRRGAPVRSLWRRSKQCGLTLMRLAAWRGRGGRRVPGEAMDVVW